MAEPRSSGLARPFQYSTIEGSAQGPGLLVKVDRYGVPGGGCLHLGAASGLRGIARNRTCCHRIVIMTPVTCGGEEIRWSGGFRNLCVTPSDGKTGLASSVGMVAWLVVLYRPNRPYGYILAIGWVWLSTITNEVRA
jgi:hypothetical protein